MIKVVVNIAAIYPLHNHVRNENYRGKARWNLYSGIVLELLVDNYLSTVDLENQKDTIITIF